MLVLNNSVHKISLKRLLLGVHKWLNDIRQSCHYWPWEYTNGWMTYDRDVITGRNVRFKVFRITRNNAKNVGYGMYRITQQFKLRAASEWQVARGKGGTTVRRNISIVRPSSSAHYVRWSTARSFSVVKTFTNLQSCHSAKTVSKPPESSYTIVRIYLLDGKM